MFHYLRNKIQTSLCKPKNVTSTTLNKEIESKMYSKNEFILDCKKKTNKKKKKKKKKMMYKKKKKKNFFFKKLNWVIFFFQNVKTDQPGSRVHLQPI